MTAGVFEQWEFDRHWLTVSQFESVVFGVRVCEGARVILSQALGVVEHALNYQLVLDNTKMSLMDSDNNVRQHINYYSHFR